MLSFYFYFLIINLRRVVNLLHFMIVSGDHSNSFNFKSTLRIEHLFTNDIFLKRERFYGTFWY